MDEIEEPPAFPKAMGAPATRAIVQAGYARVEELSGASERTLLSLHGVGPKAIRVIKATLAERGLPALAS